MTASFENLTLWQRVHRHLREEILAERLAPGTELSEVALSKELSVSRGPIREAMGRLAAEGLVSITPRRSAVVRSMTTEELIDAYQVREALEVLAVRLAVPRLTEQDLQDFADLVDRMAAHAKVSEATEFFEANVAFHELFCRLSGNQKLSQVHHALITEMRRFEARTLSLRGNLDRSVTEHRDILEAASRGDADEAARLASVHVRVPTERMDEVLRSQARGSEATSGAAGLVPE